ncbi:MAG: hypothetical protein U9R57_15350 [Thermodesulfobacteriota bacterium]|nr:hypothetical protein [Thermodesulfobacteriota bacterium]
MYWYTVKGDSNSEFFFRHALISPKADLGIAQILLDVRADTYLLRLPEVNFDATAEDHPTILSWNEVTKQKKLEELLLLWENSGDILERRRCRLGMFYQEE